MKNLLKLMLGAGLALTLTSCAVSDPYGNNYPNQYPNQYPNNRYPQGGVYRAGDGTVYRQGEVYRDRNGNVYRDGRVIAREDVYGRPGILSRGGSYPVYGQNQRNLHPGNHQRRHFETDGNKNGPHFEIQLFESRRIDCRHEKSD